MRAVTRPGQKTAHLIVGESVALCGRPGAGRWPGTWVTVTGTPPVQNRCADCDTVARNRNRRPTVPTMPWRA